jgi:hypothetical protein
MLADFLNNAREHAIGEIDERAEALQGPGSASVERPQRLNGLLDELIAALGHGGVDDQTVLVAPEAGGSGRRRARSDTADPAAPPSACGK